MSEEAMSEEAMSEEAMSAEAMSAEAMSAEAMSEEVRRRAVTFGDEQSGFNVIISFPGEAERSAQAVRDIFQGRFPTTKDEYFTMPGDGQLNAYIAEVVVAESSGLGAEAVEDAVVKVIPELYASYWERVFA